MTAIAAPYHHSPRRFPFVLLLAVLLVVLAVPTLLQCAHASLHAEADTIRQCAADPSRLLQVWLNKSGDRLNCLVQLPDGRVGDEVIQYSCRQLKWLEVTSYIIGDGSLNEAIRVLSAKGCSRVWPVD